MNKLELLEDNTNENERTVDDVLADLSEEDKEIIKKVIN